VAKQNSALYPNQNPILVVWVASFSWQDLLVHLVDAARRTLAYGAEVAEGSDFGTDILPFAYEGDQDIESTCHAVVVDRACQNMDRRDIVEEEREVNRSVPLDVSQVTLAWSRLSVEEGRQQRHACFHLDPVAFLVA
jgi:hypothetical protein